jgi:S-adenosylhomocysteine hydrolase
MIDQVVSTRIEWVREHCQLLRTISAEFRRTLPFGGLTIGTGIHLEAKTVALLLTLRDRGATLVSTGNLNTTQPDAVETLRAEGITVIGGPTKDSEVHASYLGEVLAAESDLILDNGGDLFARYLGRPTRGCSAAPRKRPRAGCGSNHCGPSSGVRSWSSTTVPSSSSPKLLAVRRPPALNH